MLGAHEGVVEPMGHAHRVLDHLGQIGAEAVLDLLCLRFRVVGGLEDHAHVFKRDARAREDRKSQRPGVAEEADEQMLASDVRQPMLAGLLLGDAEGLLMRPARVLRPHAIKALPRNAGIEALAVLDFGRLLVISEGGSGDLRRAWIIDNAILAAREYPVSDGFEPVDAAELPNGDLLVLERRFNGFLPPFFSARIAYIAAATLERDQPITAERHISLKGIVASENWEGLAIAEDQGRIVIWLVSDDNQKWPQNTLLAKISLADLMALKTVR